MSATTVHIQIPILHGHPENTPLKHPEIWLNDDGHHRILNKALTCDLLNCLEHAGVPKDRIEKAWSECMSGRTDIVTNLSIEEAERVIRECDAEGL